MRSTRRTSSASPTGFGPDGDSTMRWTRWRSASGAQAVNWILDADIKGFFDNISHEWMMRFVEHRIGDRRVLRLIRKMAEGGRGGGRCNDSRRRRAPRKGRSSRRCWRTSIFITPTIYGPSNGGNAMRAAR